ncbi:MAG: hypothetical protein HY782_26470 [Chloroflexi bacterium]|nr:hypothetical protein [Chloroflexota bacterium]
MRTIDGDNSSNPATIGNNRVRRNIAQAAERSAEGTEEITPKIKNSGSEAIILAKCDNDRTGLGRGDDIISIGNRKYIPGMYHDDADDNGNKIRQGDGQDRNSCPIKSTDYEKDNAVR